MKLENREITFKEKKLGWFSYLFFAIVITCIGCDGCEDRNTRQGHRDSECEEITFNLTRGENGYSGEFKVPVTWPPKQDLEKIEVIEEHKKYIKEIICIAPDPNGDGNSCKFFYPDDFYYKGTNYKGNGFTESVDGDIITYTSNNGDQTISMGIGKDNNAHIYKKNENCPCTEYNGYWTFKVLFSKEYFEPETVSKKLKVCFHFYSPFYADPKPD